MAAATKIVIVAGQEFSVPAETDNEAIRQQLAAMGFADVASATVQKGKRKVGEEEVETVEFVKKAGTKGAGAGEELAALLATVPRITGSTRQIIGPSREQVALLCRLGAGELSLDELHGLTEIDAALTACATQAPHVSQEGEHLCRHLDPLPAVAATRAPRGW